MTKKECCEYCGAAYSLIHPYDDRRPDYCCFCGEPLEQLCDDEDECEEEPSYEDAD